MEIVWSEEVRGDVPHSVFSLFQEKREGGRETVLRVGVDADQKCCETFGILVVPLTDDDDDDPCRDVVLRPTAVEAIRRYAGRQAEILRDLAGATVARVRADPSFARGRDGDGNGDRDGCVACEAVVLTCDGGGAFAVVAYNEHNGWYAHSFFIESAAFGVCVEGLL